MCVTWTLSHGLAINSSVQIWWFKYAVFVKFKGWYCVCVYLYIRMCLGEWALSPRRLPADHNFSCVSKKLFKGAKKCSQGLGNGLPLCVCGCACKGECVWPVFVIMNNPPPFPESPAVLSVCVFELLYVPGDPHFPYLWGQSQFCCTNKKKDKVHRSEGIWVMAGFLEQQ